MGAIRLDLIRRYLRPHRKVVLIGVAALVVVVGAAWTVLPPVFRTPCSSPISTSTTWTCPRSVIWAGTLV